MKPRGLKYTGELTDPKCFNLSTSNRAKPVLMLRDVLEPPDDVGRKRGGEMGAGAGERGGARAWKIGHAGSTVRGFSSIVLFICGSYT